MSNYSVKDVSTQVLCNNKRGGKNRSRLYRVWCTMRERCHNSNSKTFERYGGRGIEICDEWNSYDAFREWSLLNGYASGLQIDRIDNSKGYCPGNCRWVGRKINCNNTRRNVHLTAFGETKTIAQWSRDVRCVVPYTTLYQRVFRLGYDHERALTQVSERLLRHK